jgi:MinD-like ATPase involved in chromosome partitioning or flagellar assembly
MIYTFYSFKGGVGRSMALANIAELFYRRGLKVLMVDFDLEAPGLERYFNVNKAPTTTEILGKRGLIDMLVSYKQMYSLPKIIQENGSQQNKVEEASSLIVEPLEDFCVQIYQENQSGGELLLIPAGRRSGNYFKKYAENVQGFDWQDFYINWEGERFFEWFRESANNFTDVVLIDSRTGITEMGGICTHQLADAVVMFVGANQQNLDGTLKMATSLFKKDLIENGRKGRKLSILPVPSRIDSFESESLDEFAESFKNTLGQFIPEDLEFTDNLFTELKIPYWPYYSYQERVAVRDSAKDSASDLSKAFERISYAMSSLAPNEKPLERYRKSFDNNKIAFHNFVKLPIISKFEPLPESAFVAGIPIDHPSHFFGRQKELKRIFGLLKRQPLQNVAIIGQRRSGKTSLLNYLRYITTVKSEELRLDQKSDWLDKPQAYRWIFVDFQDVRMAYKERLLRYLLESMELPIPNPCNLERFMAQVSENIIVPTVILMDEVGVGLQRCPGLDDAFWESLRSLATNQTDGNLAFILTTKENPMDLARNNGHSSPFFNIFGYTTTLGAFTDSEARELIASSPQAFSTDDTEWILTHSKKWPHLLQSLCQTCLFHMQEGDPTDDWKTEGLQQISRF